ncbi:hypothetical protein AGOR_G00089180 [Albula goreensis]|uniref:Pre-mRNA-processing factor 39 n=1 Tax=Albula goreensis TaxID=1534307 RepID=A0A8T3DPW4_9TELE|nr:hypothetical protein AGOR_G00089180 [Albula goreensis]
MEESEQLFSGVALQGMLDVDPTGGFSSLGMDAIGHGFLSESLLSAQDPVLIQGSDAAASPLPELGQEQDQSRQDQPHDQTQPLDPLDHIPVGHLEPLGQDLLEQSEPFKQHLLQFSEPLVQDQVYHPESLQKDQGEFSDPLEQDVYQSDAFQREQLGFQDSMEQDGEVFESEPLQQHQDELLGASPKDQVAFLDPIEQNQVEKTEPLCQEEVEPSETLQQDHVDQSEPLEQNQVDQSEPSQGQIEGSELLQHDQPDQMERLKIDQMDKSEPAQLHEAEQSEPVEKDLEENLESSEPVSAQPAESSEQGSPTNMELEETSKDGVEESPTALEVPFPAEFDKFYRVVEDNPEDFTGWTYLLQHVEQENHIGAARKAFNAFFAHYPYCYGYWKKYADMEKRLDSTQMADEVYRRGLQAIPLSVDLWLHFIGFLRETADASDGTAESRIRAWSVGYLCLFGLRRGQNNRKSIDV